jgi:uncharacterized iron-regulated membrane protein
MKGDARRRKTWSSIHRWLGLGLGTWFALVGLTGAVLVYEDPIDAWLNPGLLLESSPGPQLPPPVILDRALEEFPRGAVERIRPPAAPGHAYRVLLKTDRHDSIDSPRVEAMFGAASGRLLGQRDAEAHGLSAPLLVKTFYDFHRNVLLGNAGSNIVGIAGFLLLGSALTGLATAWPRNRAGWARVVGVKLRAGATRVLYDLHRSAGTLVVVALLLILATVTGSTLVYLNYARDLVSLFSKVEPFPVIPWVERPAGEWPAFDEVVKRVKAVHPGLEIADIHIPARPTTGYLLYLRGPGDVHRFGDTIVWVHPATGDLLVERSARTRTAGESLMHWLFPLHTGSAFGFWGRVAMCLAGIAPLLLVFTGLWVWLRKRRVEVFEAARRAKMTA